MDWRFARGSVRVRSLLVSWKDFLVDASDFGILGRFSDSTGGSSLASAELSRLDATCFGWAFGDLSGEFVSL